MTQSSMLHVRVDDQLKAEASAKLSAVGLTLSDAVRILLTRITIEGGLPMGLTADPSAYDMWFKRKVREALASSDDGVAHDDVMTATQAIIERKSRGKNRMESKS